MQHRRSPKQSFILLDWKHISEKGRRHGMPWKYSLKHSPTSTELTAQFGKWNSTNFLTEVLKTDQRSNFNAFWGQIATCSQAVTAKVAFSKAQRWFNREKNGKVGSENFSLPILLISWYLLIAATYIITRGSLPTEPETCCKTSGKVALHRC